MSWSLKSGSFSRNMPGMLGISGSCVSLTTATATAAVTATATATAMATCWPAATPAAVATELYLANFKVLRFPVRGSNQLAHSSGCFPDLCLFQNVFFSNFPLADIGVWTLCPLPLHHRPGLDVAAGRTATSRQKYSGGNLCRCCCSCTLHIAPTGQPPDNVICCCRSCCCWCCSCCCVCFVAALVIASVSADPKQVSDTQDCKNCFNWKV